MGNFKIVMRLKLKIIRDKNNFINFELQYGLSNGIQGRRKMSYLKINPTQNINNKLFIS